MSLKFPLLAALFSKLCVVACAQPGAETYRELIKKAEAAYEAKQYLPSAQCYSRAFAVAGKSESGDRYNAACSWARAGHVDSAFYNLFAITQLAGWSNYGHLMADADLESLHQYKAWDILRSQVRANLHKHLDAADTSLADELTEIQVLDQKFRMRLDDAAEKYGHGSTQEKALWDSIRKYDEANLKRITGLLEERGWMTRSQIGTQGVQTVFLVLQHADHNVQIRYMPMMRQAAKTGELPMSSFALFEDRVLLGDGKKQIYGSQVQCAGDSCYLLPLEDPEHVDERRFAAGLEPIADYVGRWNIKWDASVYRRKDEKKKR